jgi:hypothetical protein
VGATVGRESRADRRKKFCEGRYARRKVGRPRGSGRKVHGARLTAPGSYATRGRYNKQFDGLASKRRVAIVVPQRCTTWQPILSICRDPSRALPDGDCSTIEPATRKGSWHDMTAKDWCIVWEFVVQDEHVGTFEEHYGPAGTWARLFSRAVGFRGTTLLRAAGTSRATSPSTAGRMRLSGGVLRRASRRSASACPRGSRNECR